MFPFGTHFWGFTKALVVHTLVSFSVYGISVVMYISVFSRYCQRWYPAFVSSFVRFCSVLIYRAYMLLWDFWGILIDPSLIFYRNTYVSNWKNKKKWGQRNWYERQSSQPHTQTTIQKKNHTSERKNRKQNKNTKNQLAADSSSR